MSASAIFVVVVLLFVGCGLLTWISIRGASRAASIEEIAARMARAASKARAKGTTLLERHVDFDYYDVDGEAQLPHLICLAMQDVVMEAELNSCFALDTPKIAVDLDRHQIHVTLEVLRLDEPSVEVRA